MGLFRDRSRGDGGTVRLQMREKLLAIGDDSWIDDEAGKHVYKVNGKAARLRATFVLEAPDGTEVAKIKQRPVHLRDTMTIELDGRSATVKKALVGIRDRFHVEVDGQEDLKIHGNIVDHEYEIEQSGRTVATISKKWFRVRDSYGVEIQPTADVPLILAVTVAVDDLSHD
jgi:uncharacterized protein YxjI